MCYYYCYYVNQPFAVACGFALCAINFCWKMTRKFYIKDNNEGNGYEITGPLFFGTASKFIRFFESLNKKDDDSDTIIIDLKIVIY